MNRYAGQNYAGIKAREDLIANGHDGVNNYGEEYIAFEPTQIKSVDNNGNFSADDPNIYHQFAERNLIAYHNIDEENLMRAAQLGGLPVPSIAVTHKDIPFDQFGAITLIGNDALIDPRRKGNDVYERDAWTSTFPRIVYDKLKNADVKAFFGEIKDAFLSLGDKGKRSLSELDYKFNNGESRENAFRDLHRSLGMRYYYVTKELGKTVNLPTEKVTSAYDFILKNKKACETI